MSQINLPHLRGTPCQAAARGLLRHRAYRHLPSIPTEWKWFPLREFFTVVQHGLSGTQEKIASAIQDLEKKEELHEQKSTFLQALFRTYLHKLITARTRVQKLALPAGDRTA